MSDATKCDRCGGFYEQGGRSIRQGFGSDMEEFDLCPDCAEAFDMWMECHPVTDAPERVTESVEMSHDTREKLESDVREFSYQDPNIHTSEFIITHAPMDTVLGWLDRQAAITEREFFETACHGCERLGGDGRPTLDDLSDELRKYIVKADRLGAALDERDDQLADARESLEAAWDDNAELKAEIATLKEHRAANMEKLHELTDECAELRKYRDEWKGLAEKYRADSIAAQAETERYRAKLGDVLDAIHEAERVAR